MKKPKSLSKLLVATVPAIAAKPDMLNMWVEEGSVRSRLGPSLSFEQVYTLSILITAFAGNTVDVFVPLLAWIDEFQPDLLAGNDPDAFRYDVELIDGDKADLDIRMKLTERVRVTAKPGGGWEAETLDEPPLGDEFPGAPRLLKLFWGDELALP
jgi:hypothetical protein